MKKTLLTAIFASAMLNAAADVPVDFDKIKNWTGQGENRAALAITAGLDPASDPTYVWGYRFDITTDENNKKVYPTAEDMFKAICAANDNLVLLTQYTGAYGATVCGIGIGEADKILDNLYFDFDSAKDYEFINFDYYSGANKFGQAEAPGDNTPEITQRAIADAAESHCVQHPIDALAYGYPAYDYDWWLLKDNTPDGLLWHAGWYKGYWSYWTGRTGEDWAYSGTGFSGRRLTDGCVDGWTYTVFETPGVGGFGEGTPPAANPELLYYVPEKSTTSIAGTALAPEPESATLWFNMSGMCVATCRPGATPLLAPGIYIARTAGSARKVIIR